MPDLSFAYEKHGDCYYFFGDGVTMIVKTKDFNLLCLQFINKGGKR